MKYWRIIFLLILYSSLLQKSFSQSQQVDKKGSEKGEWLFITNIAFPTLEADGLFKVNSVAVEGFFGKEFILNKSVSIITGIEHLRIKANYNLENQNEYFLRNNYFTVPVILNLKYNKDKVISPYLEIGFYGSYLYYSKLEVERENYKESKNSLGFSFGMQVAAGVRFNVTDDFNIYLGLKSKGDLFTSYRSSVQEYKITDYYGLQLGLGLKL